MDCERCHTPDKGAPKFNHDVMTGFARTGVEVKVFAVDSLRAFELGKRGEVEFWVSGEGMIDAALEKHFPFTKKAAAPRRPSTRR